jgi:nucleoside-diphosphate-sugar epimerase
MQSILITGGSGYIAQSFLNSCSERYNISTISRKDFDLTDTNKTKAFFQDKFFDTVIHTSIVGGSRLTKDEDYITYKNLLMFDNLLLNKQHYYKLISFGSGAEIYQSNTPYGLSKKTINRIIESSEKMFNLRIFGVFDHNELETRFIKQCINACITNAPINIHQNRVFDFFYMQDLIKVVEYYINNDSLLNVFDCCYKLKYSLLDIAQKIKLQLNSNTTINIESLIPGQDYVGMYIDTFNDYIGIDRGIADTITASSKLKANI